MGRPPVHVLPPNVLYPHNNSGSRVRYAHPTQPYIFMLSLKLSQQAWGSALQRVNKKILLPLVSVKVLLHHSDVQASHHSTIVILELPCSLREVAPWSVERVEYDSGILPLWMLHSDHGELWLLRVHEFLSNQRMDLLGNMWRGSPKYLLNVLDANFSMLLGREANQGRDWQRACSFSWG
jgi:hypothetical protein